MMTVTNPTNDLIDKRAKIVEMLQKNVCQVTFEKVNGEIRVMPCTLRRDIVPLYEHSSNKKPNNETVAVWCMDKESWRSFRVESVVEILILDSKYG